MAFGHTRSMNAAQPLPAFDLWLVRTNVDGMVDFSAASGFDEVNDTVGWRRTAGILSVPLAPAGTPAALTNVSASLSVDPATPVITPATN
jgi:hypothetical protein